MWQHVSPVSESLLHLEQPLVVCCLLGPWWTQPRNLAGECEFLISERLTPECTTRADTQYSQATINQLPRVLANSDQLYKTRASRNLEATADRVDHHLEVFRQVFVAP